jgi:periplasmic protein TonB
MIKILPYIIFLLLLQANSFGQSKKPKETYYAFDENWKAVQLDKAKYLTYVLNYSDTMYEWNNYNFSGPLLNIETYKDKDAIIPHGYFAWYDEKGRIDSNGYVFEKKKHGKWHYFTDSLSVIVFEEYEMGRLIKRTDFRDSINNKKSESEKLAADEREAAFSGGDKGWRKYLENNYKHPLRAQNLGIGGMALLAFTIDIQGKVTELKILKSVEFSLDREALRLIQQAPKWIPAQQGGRLVKAYRRQPITFAAN